LMSYLSSIARIVQEIGFWCKNVAYVKQE